MSNPSLTETVRAKLVSELMRARRAVLTALRAKNKTAEHDARKNVDAAKKELGERGPVWWTDGTPDYNHFKVQHTPYDSWFAGLED